MTEAHFSEDILQDEGEVEVPGVQFPEEDQMPRSWSGALSDTSFTARMEEGVWVLGVKVEAESPVLIQNVYCDTPSLEAHAEMFDFALAFARGDACNEDHARREAMGLCYAKSFFGQTGQNLKNSVKMRSKQIEIDPESRQALRSSDESADVMIRIASRIEDRLEALVGKQMISLLERSPANQLSN